MVAINDVVYSGSEMSNLDLYKFNVIGFFSKHKPYL